MRAKRVDEAQNFQRGQDPKRSMDIGYPVPNVGEIMDMLIMDEHFEPIDIFVNELLDVIYREFPAAKPEDAMRAIENVVSESLDNWYQTTAQ